jgi:hypothetical protein
MEYLAIGIREWRILLAAGIELEPDQDPADVAALANELLALWDGAQAARSSACAILVS